MRGWPPRPPLSRSRLPCYSARACDRRPPLALHAWLEEAGRRLLQANENPSHTACAPGGGGARGAASARARARARAPPGARAHSCRVCKQTAITNNSGLQKGVRAWPATMGSRGRRLQQWQRSIKCHVQERVEMCQPAASLCLIDLCKNMPQYRLIKCRSLLLAAVAGRQQFIGISKVGRPARDKGFGGGLGCVCALCAARWQSCSERPAGRKQGATTRNLMC